MPSGTVRTPVLGARSWATFGGTRETCAGCSRSSPRCARRASIPAITPGSCVRSRVFPNGWRFWRCAVTKERLFIFDTTLRDGAQTQGVDFSVEDKRQIALALDAMGVDYVEGGWPGANPTDTAFFSERPPLKRARFTAFGMTKRVGRSLSNDPGFAAVIDADTDAVCLVGKTWDFQVDVA